MHKNLLLLTVGIIMMGCASNQKAPSATTTYFGTVYELNFSNESPDTVYVDIRKCVSSDCSQVSGDSVPLINGDEYVNCVNKYPVPIRELHQCIDLHRLDTNIINTNEMNSVAVELPVTDYSNDVYLAYFSPGDNSYFPMVHYSSDFECNNDTYCYVSPTYPLNFGKGLGATSYIKSLKTIAKNTSPVVDISASEEYMFGVDVCSALSSIDGEYDFPELEPPFGYSELSHQNKIEATLSIDGNVIKSIIVESKLNQDTCESFELFELKPYNSYVGKILSFNVSSYPYGNNLLTSVKSHASIEWKVQK